MLTSRAVQVTWGEPSVSARFPVNIDENSKAGLPSVLGARPDEQQLLAYFHGRISEEDLIELLEQRAAQALTGAPGPDAPGSRAPTATPELPPPRLRGKPVRSGRNTAAVDALTTSV